MKVHWPRSPIVWTVWVIAVALLVLSRATDREFDWGFFVLLFVFLGLRSREESRANRRK